MELKFCEVNVRAGVMKERTHDSIWAEAPANARATRLIWEKDMMSEGDYQSVAVNSMFRRNVNVKDNLI